MHDYREHRKIEFHAKLLEQSGNVVFDSKDGGFTSRYLQRLRYLMNEYFPAKTVRMSTRNPPWMTPLAKALLKEKARLNLAARMDAPLFLKKELMRALQKIVNRLRVERWALRPGGKRSMRCQRERKDPTQALTRTL